MQNHEAQSDEVDRVDQRDDAVAAEAIGKALEEALQPVTGQPLPRRVVNALAALEDAEDWRWVRG